MDNLIKKLNLLIDSYKRQNKSYTEFVNDNQGLVNEVVGKFFGDNWRLEIYYRSFKYFIRIGLSKALYLIDKEIQGKINNFNLKREEDINKNTYFDKFFDNLEFDYIKKFISSDDIDEKIIDYLVLWKSKTEIAWQLWLSRTAIYNRLDKIRNKLKILYNNLQ